MSKPLSSVVICTSAVPRQYLPSLKEKAIKLGAVISSNFNAHTTHLIAERAGSLKHREALKRNIPVVTCAWIDACLEDHDCVDTSNFLLPPLMSLVLSVTGISSQQRLQAKEIAESLGALFFFDFKVTCTHLIGSTPTGKKYEVACKRNIPIVSLDWLIQCQNQQQLVDERKFSLVQQEHAPGLCSVEGGVNLSSASTGSPYKLTIEEKRLLYYSIPPMGLYLDKVWAFLWNPDPVLYPKILKILRATGATRCIQWTSLVTHVLAPDPHDNSQLQFSNLSAQVLDAIEKKSALLVSFKWIEVCCVKQRYVDATPFIIDTTLYAKRKYMLLDQNMQENTNVAKRQSELFRGLRFNLGPLAIFDVSAHSSAAELINTHAGKILPHDATGSVVIGVPTHVLCPPHNSTIRPLREDNSILVTMSWLQACINASKLLVPSACILYKPLMHKAPLPGFQDFHVCLSGFYSKSNKPDFQRQNLIKMILLSGASFSERLVRGKTTHLIYDKSNGKSPKYDCALSWNISIVSPEWLHACLNSGEAQSMSDYCLESHHQEKGGASTILRKSSLVVERESDSNHLERSSLRPASQPHHEFSAIFNHGEDTQTRFSLEQNCPGPKNEDFINSSKLSFKEYDLVIPASTMQPLETSQQPQQQQLQQQQQLSQQKHPSHQLKSPEPPQSPGSLQPLQTSSEKISPTHHDSPESQEVRDVEQTAHDSQTHPTSFEREKINFAESPTQDPIGQKQEKNGSRSTDSTDKPTSSLSIGEQLREKLTRAASSRKRVVATLPLAGSDLMHNIKRTSGKRARRADLNSNSNIENDQSIFHNPDSNLSQSQVIIETTFSPSSLLRPKKKELTDSRPVGRRKLLR